MQKYPKSITSDATKESENHKYNEIVIWQLYHAFILKESRVLKRNYYEKT